MTVNETALPGVLLIEPKMFGDERGFFLETFHADRYAGHGIVRPFVQDNLSRSARGVLRGLHFQSPDSQGKLVSVMAGAVLDVAVDVRVGSPHFGKYLAIELNDRNRWQLWIPRGFAHGFLVLSDTADFHYKCDWPYAPSSEKCIRWNDPAIGIAWSCEAPALAPRDRDAPLLADVAGLPVYGQV